MNNKLLLPGDPGFAETMATAMQPGWQNVAATASTSWAFCLRDDGLMVPLVDAELEDYLYGGEYDEVTEEDESNLQEMEDEISEGWFILK